MAQKRGEPGFRRVKAAQTRKAPPGETRPKASAFTEEKQRGRQSPAQRDENSQQDNTQNGEQVAGGKRQGKRVHAPGQSETGRWPVRHLEQVTLMSKLKRKTKMTHKEAYEILQKDFEEAIWEESDQDKMQAYQVALQLLKAEQQN